MVAQGLPVVVGYHTTDCVAPSAGIFFVAVVSFWAWKRPFSVDAQTLQCFICGVGVKKAKHDSVVVCPLS